MEANYRKSEKTLLKQAIFQKLEEKGHYYTGLNACLCQIEASPINREAATAAFWDAYFGEEVPKLTKAQIDKIQNIIDKGITGDLTKNKARYLVYVKLILAGLIIFSEVGPDIEDLLENSSITDIIEKAKEYIQQLGVNIKNDTSWGTEQFEKDIFSYTGAFVMGIVYVEYAYLQYLREEYEEAFSNIYEGFRYLCATSRVPNLQYESQQQEFLESLGKQDSQFLLAPLGDKSMYQWLPHTSDNFNMQEAINIFEKIKENKTKVKNWTKVADICLNFKHFIRDVVGGEWGVRDVNGREISELDYMVDAYGFAMSQMIPDNIARLLTTKSEIEVEERLKRDFFNEIWMVLEKDVRKHLISTEDKWARYDISGMLDDYRQALELELVKIFPFLQEKVSNQKKNLNLTIIKDQLESNLMVKTWVHQCRLGSDEEAFLLQDLPKHLRDLIEARNAFIHPERSGTPIQDTMKNRVRAIHNGLLGIGCKKGILPHLLAIKKTLKYKESS